MRRASTLLLLLFTACTPSLDFRQFPACFEEVHGGRVLHDPGRVLSEYADEEGQWLMFQGEYWPHPVPVRKVNRHCELVRAIRGAGAPIDFSAPAERSSLEEP